MNNPNDLLKATPDKEINRKHFGKGKIPERGKSRLERFKMRFRGYSVFNVLDRKFMLK